MIVAKSGDWWWRFRWWVNGCCARGGLIEPFVFRSSWDDDSWRESVRRRWLAQTIGAYWLGLPPDRLQCHLTYLLSCMRRERYARERDRELFKRRYYGRLGFCGFSYRVLLRCVYAMKRSYRHA